MHLIVGKDKEEIKRVLDPLLKEIQGPVSTYYPESFSVQDFFQEVETLPFLAPKKILILHQIDLLSSTELEVICRYLEKPVRWISLFLTATEYAPLNRLIKLVEKNGKILRIKDEKPWDKEKRLIDWMIQYAKNENVTLSMQVATSLAQKIEHQMIQAELDKLICFIGTRREIALEDISEICISIHHDTFWQLSDALFAFETTRALKISNTLLNDGVAVFSLLTSIRMQFTLGIEMLSIPDKERLREKFSYLKGQLLEKKLQALRKYGKERLQQGILLIFEAEIKAKNNFADFVILLELLIMRLTVTNDTLSFTQFIRAC